jgi:hypothetical protein
MALVLASGCIDHDVDIARKLMQADPNGGPPSVVMIADCESYSAIEMDRACVVDSDGKTYGLAGGDLNVISATPPYGVYFLFVDSAVPLPADIRTTGDDASVQVYAAPYNVQGSPCCAEDNPVFPNQSNRIAARASLTDEGGLLVTIHEALPPGYQVAVTLHYGPMYRGRVHPADGSVHVAVRSLRRVRATWVDRSILRGRGSRSVERCQWRGARSEQIDRGKQRPRRSRRAARRSARSAGRRERRAD